ncbi:hypothetical protein [Nonomuraea glycinis]|uniref:hypothetical protein n=1 Tax=Nonomuraea glycinis TaxID=2047744 RepID=UPI002E153B1A|nr:hypothetical protein OHA68_19080 [Nonomuraea glycinis]
MRGQGPGSEHERRSESDDSATPSTPPTPPPSFGGRPSGEQRVPRSYPEPPSVEEAEGWLSVEGETGVADGWQPQDGGPPAEAWLSVQDEPTTPEGETSPSLPRPPVPGETRPATAWPRKGDRTRPADAWPPRSGDRPATWLPAKGGTHAAADPQAETRPAAALPPPRNTGETYPTTTWHLDESGAQAAAGPPAEGDTAGAWPPVEGDTAGAWPPARNTGEADTHPNTWHPAESGAQAAAARSSRGEEVRADQGERLPALPDFPGAQPWEVREGDAAPYDWFAGPDGFEVPPASGADVSAPAHPGHEAAMPQAAHPGHETAMSQPAMEPVVPGAPRWEPPPAFTAAAAGMQVWPAPVTDTPAMPPWPAATGELDPGDGAHDAPRSGPARPEADAPTTPAPHVDPHATAPAPQVNPHATAPAQHVDPHATAQHPTTGRPPAAASGTSETAPPTAPPHGTGQATPPPAPLHGTGQATPPPAAPHGTGRTTPLPAAPHGTDQSTPPTPWPGDIPFGTGAIAAQAGAAPFSAPVPADTDEATSPSATRKAIPGRATPTPGPKLPPSPLFDPNQGREQPDAPAAQGDVPVWPPTPHGEQQQQDKLPDLPFNQETWGRRPALALPPGGAAPPDLQPQGGAAFRQPPFTPLQVVEQPGKSKRALFATLGVLVLAGVATGGFFAVRSVSAPAPEAAPEAAPSASVSAPPSATPTAAPAVPTPAEAAGAAILNSEITDPKKLSLKEAFPKKKVSAAGATFTRVKSDVAESCQEAAAGAFAEALREQKCSRVVRATYVDAKRRWAVTTGIAVLPSKDAALRVDKAKNLNRNLWFRGLPGSTGSGGDRVHIAGGYAAGLVWGRYIVFSYATHADGHTPTAKEKALVKVSSAFRDQTSLVLERRVADS